MIPLLNSTWRIKPTVWSAIADDVSRRFVVRYQIGEAASTISTDCLPANLEHSSSHHHHLLCTLHYDEGGWARDCHFRRSTIRLSIIIVGDVMTAYLPTDENNIISRYIVCSGWLCSAWRVRPITGPGLMIASVGSALNRNCSNSDTVTPPKQQQERDRVSGCKNERADGVKDSGLGYP